MLFEVLERLIASLDGAVGRDGRACRIDPAVCGNRGPNVAGVAEFCRFIGMIQELRSDAVGNNTIR